MLFEEVKELFTNHNILFQDHKLRRQSEPLSFFQAICHAVSGSTRKERFKTDAAKNYVLKTLDFLLENGLINEEMIREIFHEEKAVKQFVLHAFTSISSKAEFRILKHCNKLTEHWYWPYLNKFYQVLGQEEKDIMDLTFYEGRFSSKGEYELKLNYIFVGDPHSFPLEKYFHQLKNLDKSNHLNSHGTKNNHSGHLQSSDYEGSEKEMEEIIKQLIYEGCCNIHFVNTGEYETYLADAINLFSFMENKMYPGIIKKLLNIPEFLNIMHKYLGLSEKYENPEELFQLIKCWSQIRTSQEMASHYEKMSRSNKIELKNVSWKKDIYDGYLNQISQALHQSAEIYDSISKRKNEVLSSIKCPLKDIYENAPRVLTKMKNVHFQESK
ncbi:hypothetical protein PGTUg99_036756 [Puccinia graminis f. sp. tritici]|uniref:Uncharacterized protein n=1 Tax=Puccinia graminis f. sp. tritici TaxID=56615 RepID=A0A5B0RRH7_PUCGR|nr:hypothetical protein PGTUg99_036756 [Puccinia graminis f. sp. tritici]